MINLVMLYNRLSYYFCNNTKDEEKQFASKLSENMTIKELQELLDEYYKEHIQK